MTTYKVSAQYTTYFYTHIEAENYEQAQEMANNLDRIEFNDACYTEWDIYSIDGIGETA